MEVILPEKQVKEVFFAAAQDLGFDPFVARKYVLIMKESDLDVYPVIGDERVALLLYGWIKCNDYATEMLQKDKQIRITSSFKIIATSLTQYTLSLWFSQEWNKCAPKRQKLLLHTFRKSYIYLTKMTNLCALNWDYILNLYSEPWNNHYINQFFDIKYIRPLALRESVDCIQAQATAEDITYVKTEGVLLILFRFIKLLDAGSMEAVKQISICVIAAWNRIVESLSSSKRKKMIANMHADEKRALIYICHIHLMTIYEMDNVQGFVIDNIINNIKFYHQSIQEASSKCIHNAKELKHTSARFIASTCIYLNVSSSEFFEAIMGKFDVCLSTLFGTICKAYISYLLGNLLMEINNKNDEDIENNLEIFKRLLNSYVKEREQSELFILGEMRKKEWQKTSHNLNYTVNYETDFKSKICKGNRMSNISKCENSDEDEQDTLEAEDNHRRVDPVFQNLPNNLNILRYVYNILAMRKYKGWHFAKLVLLCKIIGYELNEIEKWRYHPGLTTEFMLNLEINLSRYYADLAKIFQDHPFMEQEFWLTAFYLDPNNLNREAVARCGMRNSKRIIEEQEKLKRLNSEPNNMAETDLKFGLLSSTIDVNEIVNIVNHDAPIDDYEPLYRALRAFRLPEKIIKDLLTVIFVPRNSSFSWALDWHELKQRCRFLAKRPEHKRHLVELSMAEANDRLKFLKIDYDKYKNRPQLDYGSIERGYENVTNLADLTESDDDFLDEEDFEDYDDYRSRCAELNKQRAKIKQEHLDMLSSYSVGTRLTRARTAAAIASSTYKEICDEKDNDSSGSESENEDSNDSTAHQLHQVDFFNDQQMVVKLEPPTIKDEEDEEFTEMYHLTELLKERTAFCNNTSGFKSFLDVWDINDLELKKVESETIATNEIENALSIFKKLGDLKKTTLSNISTNCDSINMETKLHAETKTYEKEKRKRKQRKHSITLEAHKNKDKKLTDSHTQDNECIYKKASKRKKLSEKEVDLDNKKLKKTELRQPLDNTEKLKSEAAREQKNHEVDKVGNDDSNKLKQTENSNRDNIHKEIIDDKTLSMMDADRSSVTVNDSIMTCLSVTSEKIQNIERNDRSDQVVENITVESILKDTEDNVLASNDNEEEKENISHINASVDTNLKLASPNLTDEKDLVSESVINSNTSRPTSGEMNAQSLEEIGLPSSLTGEEKVVMLGDDDLPNRKSYTSSPVNNCDNLNSIASFKSKDKTKNKQNVADTICEKNSKEKNIQHKSQETLVQILTTTKALSTDSKVDGTQPKCLNENDMKANIITSKENEHTCVQEIHAISISLSDENKSRSLRNEGHECLEEERLIVQNTACNTQHENFGEAKHAINAVEMQKCIKNEYSIQENKIKTEQMNSKNINLEEAATRKNKKLSEIGKTKNVTTNLEAVNMKLEIVVANKTPNVTIDEVPEILNIIDHKMDSYANDEATLNSINKVNDDDTGKNYETVNDNYTVNDNISVNNNGTINDSKSVTGCKSNNDNSNNSSNVNKSDNVNDDETAKKDNGLISDGTPVGNNDNDTANDIVNDNNTSNDHVTVIVNKTDNIKSIDLFPNNTKHSNISENENLKNNDKQINTKKPISLRHSEHETIATENESINENSCENTKNSNRLNTSKYQELMISNTEKPDDIKKSIEDVESKTNRDGLTNLYDNHSSEEQPKSVDKNIETNVKLITEYDRLEILKKECLERQVKVNLQRLTVSAVLDAKLNNPKVLLKPLNYEKFLTEKLKSQIKETMETEESKTVCNATTVEVSQLGMKRSRRTCAAIRFRPTSSSSTDSFDDYKRKPRSSRSKRPKTSVSTKSYATKKTLVVTPRSSSGLKLRITSNEALHSVTRISIDNKLVPIINIPTSSSEEETDPLYLEEVEFVRCD